MGYDRRSLPNPTQQVSDRGLNFRWPANKIPVACLFGFIMLLDMIPVLEIRATEPPNVVLIISDDQAWTDYSFMGHPTIQTPHIDQLATVSARFDRGYVPTALCRPSLLSLITGRYAHEHKVTGNDPSRQLAKSDQEYQRLRSQLISRIDQFDLLTEHLANRGYVSLQTGKWWEGGFARGGFTEGMTRGFPQPGGRHGDDGLRIGRDARGIEPIPDFMERAIANHRPFFVWYAPFLPHQPHDRISAKYRSLELPESIKRYYTMCEVFDETIGQLMAELDRQGIRDNTLIIYVTDNGWIQDPESRRFAARSKQTAYEGGIRTPILFSWPNQIPAQHRKELCSSLDIYPTILAAAGIEVPEGLPGINWLEPLKTQQQVARDQLYGESYAHDVMNMNRPEDSLYYRWCIRGNWKLILTYDTPVGNRYRHAHDRSERRPQLFDLGSDPHELTNLAARYPQKVAELVQELEAWYSVENRKALTSWD